MLWPYELKAFEEKMNELNIDDDGINTMEKFSGITSEITIKNRHIWGCPVYVFDAILKGNIYGITKWEP